MTPPSQPTPGPSLDIRWLCRVCHKAEHARQETP